MGNEEWPHAAVESVAAPIRNALVGGPFGSNLVSKDYVENGVPVIRGQNMGSRWVTGEFAYVSTGKAEELSPNTARPGDLIFTQRGTIGQVAIVPPAPYERYIISQSQMKLTVDPSKADAAYLYYVFSSQEQQDYIRRNAIQTGVPHTNLEHLRNTPIPLPPLAEQRAIAGILGALDDKIELNRRMNETLEGMARALFQSWFVDFDPVRAKAEERQPEGMDAETAALFPDEFEESALGLIPRGWRVGTVGEVAEVVDCLHSKKPTRQPTGRPLLQLTNIRNDGLVDMTDTYLISEADFATWTTRMEAKVGDCVITNVGRVGATAQIPEGLIAALGRNMTGLRCRPAYPFPTFLIQALLSQAMAEEINNKTDTGTILDALNVRSIPLLQFVLAPENVLARFDQNVRPIRAEMEQRLRESATLAATRDALLPKLLSGEVRVGEAERVVMEGIHVSGGH